MAEARLVPKVVQMDEDGKPLTHHEIVAPTSPGGIATDTFSSALPCIVNTKKIDAGKEVVSKWKEQVKRSSSLTQRKHMPSTRLPRCKKDGRRVIEGKGASAVAEE